MAMIVPRFILTDDFSQFENLILQHGGTPAVIRRGTTIYDANVPIPHISYYIKKGLAKLALINEDGSEHILFFFGKGSIYPVTLLNESLTMESYLNFTAVTDLEVLSFPAERILDLHAADGRLFSAVIHHYVRYTNTLLYKQLMGTYNDSQKCISSFLYLYAYHSNTAGAGYTVDLTQEQIGQIIGLSRIQISRIFNGLRSDGIIQTSHSKVKVLDMEKLRSLCSEIVRDDP